jgi:hypothetical protein
MNENCIRGDIESNTHAAGGFELYGPASVLVLEADARNNSVRFLVGATEVKCDWTTDFVWTSSPTTLDCDDSTLPAVNETGTLYLSERLIEAYDLNSITIKWPDALPAPTEYRSVTVWPTAMTLRGVELGARDGEVVAAISPEVSIDLTDPAIAAPGQQIALDGKPMVLKLSQAGFQRLFKEW